MPASSTGAICGDCIVPPLRANEHRAAAVNGAQTVTLPCIPNDLVYNLNRFLGKNQDLVVGRQRPPLGFGKMQSDAEAESKGLARVRRELRAFDAQFFGASSVGK